MRITIARDGRTEIVDVAPGADSVTVGSERYPVSVVRTAGTSVELEIAGERVLVENWPEHFAEPPGPVDVNGERWTVRVQRGLEAMVAGAPPKPALSVVPESAVAPPVPARAGTPIVPPMPGKVIEIRVKDGDRVRKGDLLLILEAMKMRNEIASPADGVVRGVAVRAGANARAKEPMLFIAAE